MGRRPFYSVHIHFTIQGEFYMRRFIQSLVLLISCLLLVSVFSAAAQENTAQRNKETYVSALADASAGKLDALINLFADPYLSNQGGITIQKSSPQAVEMFAKALAAAIPDLKITPDVLIAQDDLLAGSLTYSGTFTQPFSFAIMGPNAVPPTNKAVQWTEMTFLRFNNEGKITESWIVSDPGGM